LTSKGILWTLLTLFNAHWSIGSSMEASMLTWRSKRWYRGM